MSSSELLVCNNIDYCMFILSNKSPCLHASPHFLYLGETCNEMVCREATNHGAPYTMVKCVPIEEIFKEVNG